MKRLLYVGQFAAIKGPAVAAAAMVSILRREVGVTATWVCAQSDHEKVAALFPEALRARVALVGWLPREELVRVYDEHGIFIFASHFEGFGQTFLEAMARGMVVLATRVGGMREVIRDGENGFLFDFGASIRIAEKALEVISNPVLAKEVSAAARKTAEAFTWARSAERFEEFVHNLGEPSIAGSPSPGVHPDHGRPAVSVVIPTYQRERVLLDTLGYLLALATKPAEIVVVDQTVCHLDDTDGELKRLQEEGLIRWIRLTKPSIPRAMNTGLEQALCEVVLFLDDDIVPSEGLIRVHQDAHSSGEHDIVVGQVLQPGERPMEAGGSFGPFRFNSNLRQVVPGVMAGNLSVRRSKALSLGGFDENFVRAAYCFETEFADRARQAGEHILFEPAASIRHLKATEGGTRVWGEHLRTIRPGHSVGAFYYLLRSPRVGNRMLGLLYRPLRAIRTKHHLQRPWWIPVTLIAEMLGLLWAVGLFLRGPRRLGWNGGLSECR
jgi:GT2 family glycosyltransferase